jgi:hypothetical protein
MSFLGFIFAHGKELKTAFKIIQLIAKTLDSLDDKTPNVGELSKAVFKLLPDKMRAPSGNTTQEEFVNVIYNGFMFYMSLKAASSR